MDNEYMQELDMQLISWLEYNNREIDSTNDATIGVRELNDLENSSNFKAKVIASAILGKNLVGPDYDGIEHTINTNDEIITALREASSPQEKYNIFTNEKFQYIASELSANYILDAYFKEKENGTFDEINIQEEVTQKQNKEFNYNEQIGNNFTNQPQNYQHNNFNNQRTNNFQSQQEFDYNEHTRNNFANQHQNYQQNTFNNQRANNFQSQQEFNYNENRSIDMRPNSAPNYNNQNTNQYQVDNNYLQYGIKEDFMRKSEGNENENIIENGLDSYINGVRTVVTPTENGTYNFKMELTMDDYNTVMWVNEKEMTKEEYARFVNRYESEILGVEKENTFNYSNELGI